MLFMLCYVQQYRRIERTNTAAIHECFLFFLESNMRLDVHTTVQRKQCIHISDHINEVATHFQVK